MRQDTILGLVDISTLFTDFILCKQVILPKGRGSTVDKPRDYVFISHVREPSGGSVNRIDGKCYFLYGKPTQQAIDLGMRCMTSGIIGAFEICKQAGDPEHAIVMAVDSRFIGSTKIAMIKSEQIPSAKQCKLYS